MAIQPGDIAPYAPPSAVLNIIDRFRNHGLAVPFTLETLQRAGVSESLAPRTLQALKLLDLVEEDGTPSNEFVDLAKASSGEYKDRLAAIIRAAYADVFSYTDPATDDVDRVEDAFRSYTPRSQRSRMVTLFLGLCRVGGLAPESVGRSSTESPGRRKLPQHKAPVSRKVSRPGTSSSTKAQQSFDGAIPPALAGLIAQLPEPGRTWTTRRRANFINAFEGALDFLFDVDDTRPSVTVGGSAEAE